MNHNAHIDPVLDSVEVSGCASDSIHTYSMIERSDRLDFDIRDQSVRPPVTQPHRHEYFQIFANQAGAAPHLLGGRRCESIPRSLIFVLPYRVHLAMVEPGSRYQLINFSSNFLRPDFTLTPLEMEEASIAHYPELTPFIYQGWFDFVFDPVEFAYIETLLQRLQKAHNHRTLGTLERARGAILELIGMTTERFATELQSLAEQRIYLQGHTDALRRIFKFIDESLHQDIGLAEVAEAAFLSPNYLSQLLKKHTGQAFVDWLTGRRMERARDLLAHTSDRVSTIAHRVGFSDEAYFTRRFNKRFGVAPTAYRRSLREAT
ncbi:helix-turn-helix transcriptional regulator [Limnohabitans sp.]|jgi:AraC-like DNA-binding protein|uniref:helix-turn-helix transcriptional regulator n=1 Tax=Limnohabitans sp. TaxID=1907725 RepID=UPI0037BF5195